MPCGIAGHGVTSLVDLGTTGTQRAVMGTLEEPLAPSPALLFEPAAAATVNLVADDLDLPQHVLRFWETRFPQIKPVKRAGGRRYYRPSDVALLTGIKRLLHDEGMTIRGVQKILRDQGARHVAGLSDDSVDMGDLLASAGDIDEAALAAALAPAAMLPEPVAAASSATPEPSAFK